MFAARRERLHFLAVLETRGFADIRSSGVWLPFSSMQIDELAPALLVEPAQLADVLLVLAVWPERDRDHVAQGAVAG